MKFLPFAIVLFFSACGSGSVSKPMPSKSHEAGQAVPAMTNRSSRFTSEQQNAILKAKEKFPQLETIQASLTESSIGESGTDILIAPKEGGWDIIFIKGWGDCPAGCINHHYWHVFVDKDGAVTLAKEETTGDGSPQD